MSGALADKVALITGASSGIGEATARMLAAEGASVAIAARRTDRLVALKADLEASGAVVLTVDLDVTDEQATRDAVESTVDDLGGLDILVNNAGVMMLGPVEDADTGDWAQMINTNVLGLMYLTHAALPHLLASQGTVVQISSVAGRVVRKGSAVYNASKHAVNAFSEGLRQEVTGRGVRVVLIEPGVVDTELRGHITDPGARAASEERARNIRQLHSADIADAVRYAVSAGPRGGQRDPHPADRPGGLR